METDLRMGVKDLDRLYCKNMRELREYLDRGEERYLKVHSVEQVVVGRSILPRMLVTYEGGSSDLSFSGFRYVCSYLELIED